MVIKKDKVNTRLCKAATMKDSGAKTKYVVLVDKSGATAMFTKENGKKMQCRDMGSI